MVYAVQQQQRGGSQERKLTGALKAGRGEPTANITHKKDFSYVGDDCSTHHKPPEKFHHGTSTSTPTIPSSATSPRSAVAAASTPKRSNKNKKKAPRVDQHDPRPPTTVPPSTHAPVTLPPLRESLRTLMLLMLALALPILSSTETMVVGLRVPVDEAPLPTVYPPPPEAALTATAILSSFRFVRFLEGGYHKRETR